jgi:uncharacterized DUF497 family protein
MRFRYDPAKAIANFRKHAVSFADAEGVFQDPLAVTQEDPDAESERHFVAVGLGSAADLLVVVCAMRNEEVPLISARRATRKERKTYES